MVIKQPAFTFTASAKSKLTYGTFSSTWNMDACYEKVNACTPLRGEFLMTVKYVRVWGGTHSAQGVSANLIKDRGTSRSMILGVRLNTRDSCQELGTRKHAPFCEIVFCKITWYSFSIKKINQKLSSATFVVTWTKLLPNNAFYSTYSHACFCTSSFSLAPLCPLVFEK